MGCAQKSAVATFDRCWEPCVPVVYFMARRWYKRASNLSRAGITISKPRKARHHCGQISGWHRSPPLSAVEHNPGPYRNQDELTLQRRSFHSLPSSRQHEEPFFFSLVTSLVQFAGLRWNPTCQPSFCHLPFLCFTFTLQPSCWGRRRRPNPPLPRLPPSHLIVSCYLPSLPSSLPFASSSSALPGWNVAVWASVNCGLSAVVSNSPEAQSQQGWSAGCSRLPPH